MPILAPLALLGTAPAARASRPQLAIVGSPYMIPEKEKGTGSDKTYQVGVAMLGVIRSRASNKYIVPQFTTQMVIDAYKASKLNAQGFNNVTMPSKLYPLAGLREFGKALGVDYVMYAAWYRNSCALYGLSGISNHIPVNMQIAYTVMGVNDDKPLTLLEMIKVEGDNDYANKEFEMYVINSKVSDPDKVPALLGEFMGDKLYKGLQKLPFKS